MSTRCKVCRASLGHADNCTVRLSEQAAALDVFVTCSVAACDRQLRCDRRHADNLAAIGWRCPEHR